MRRAFVLASIFLLGCPLAQAAVQPAPAMQAREADPTRAKLQSYLSPSLRQWVREEGRRQADVGPDLEAAHAAVRARLDGQVHTPTDVEALVQLVMQECSQQAEADLRAALDEMKAENARKKAQREAAQAQKQARASLEQDARSEFGEDQQVKLQKLEDRRAKALELLSNVMKKNSETAAGITANLK